MKPEVKQYIYHYIGGRFCPSENHAVFDNLNPFTNEVINEVSRGDEEDINKAADAASKAFKEGGWTKIKLEERLQHMYEIGKLIDRDIEEIALLESYDTGLPIAQTRKMVSRAADNFRFYAEMVRNRLVGEAYHVDDQFMNYTIQKPVGVAGLITPWNAPFMLETWKVAPALATGNTVILKPAEWSPLTANKLAELIDESGLPAGVFNIVHGFGETAGAALVAHPEVKLISFTGETVTGSEIIRNGASSLKRFSMELGGKSPIIVFDDCDIGRALDACIWGIFSFNGERCTANSRLFIQKSIQEEFVSQLKQRVDHIVVGDPSHPLTEIGPLIHRDHADNVRKYVRMAEREGAEIYAKPLTESQKLGNFVAPTLLLNMQNDMTAAQEEIFGPVLSVMTFTDEQEVIQYANDTKYGLAGYVWTNDMKKGLRVANAIDAGMLWVNSQNVRDLRIPFGGSKNSGMGREGGHYAFDFYTETKAVHVSLADHYIQQMGKKEVAFKTETIR